MHPKILVYGFGPYGPYTTNITGEVIPYLPQSAYVTYRVFDVAFDAGMFELCFRHAAPDVILGMGQHPRARKLRIERKCINTMKLAGNRQQVIDSNGPEDRFSTLNLPRTADTTLAYDAGDYVCNYSMYLAGRYCSNTDARYGFLHVPVHFSGASLIDYVVSVIEVLQSKTMPLRDERLHKARRKTRGSPAKT